jgi:hypothetical protein
VARRRKEKVMYAEGDEVEVYDGDVHLWVPGTIEAFGDLTVPSGEVMKVYLIRAHDRPFDATKPNMYAIFEVAADSQIRKVEHV